MQKVGSGQLVFSLIASFCRHLAVRQRETQAGSASFAVRVIAVVRLWSGAESARHHPPIEVPCGVAEDRHDDDQTEQKRQRPDHQPGGDD